MADEVLDNVANQLRAIQPDIMRARELIAMARQAGEEVTELQSRLNQAEVKANKWRSQLVAAGYSL